MKLGGEAPPPSSYGSPPTPACSSGAAQLLTLLPENLKMSRRPRQGMGRGRGAGCQPVPPAQGSPRMGVLAKPGFFPQQSVPSSSSRRAKLKARLQSKGHVSCLHSAEHTAKSGRVLYSASGSSWRNSRGPCALVLKCPFGTCHLKQDGRRGWLGRAATPPALLLVHLVASQTQLGKSCPQPLASPVPGGPGTASTCAALAGNEQVFWDGAGPRGRAACVCAHGVAAGGTASLVLAQAAAVCCPRGALMGTGSQPCCQQQ